MSPSLQSIDFSALDALFHVDTSSAIDTSNHQQQWRLRLYPYRTGKQLIPSLFYNGIASQPLPLDVSDAIDPKTGLPMPVVMTTSFRPDDTLWARQQFTLLYTITNPHQYSQFHFRAPAPGKPVLREFELPVVQTRTRQFEHRLGWSIHVNQPGKIKINLPPLQFISDGVTTHTFYVAPLDLDIHALPLYVPVTMPVGNIDIDRTTHWQYSATDTLSTLEVTLTGHGIDANHMPEMANRLHSHTGIRTYPLAMTSHEHFDHDGIHSEIRYALPFKTTAQGMLRFPDTTLAYFDPANGRIQSVTLQLPVIVSLRTWLATLLIAAFLLLGYRLLKQPVRQFLCYLQRFFLYHKTLRQLPTINSTEQLRQCIGRFARAKGLSENISPGQWLASCPPAAQPDSLALIDSLNRFFYQTAQRSDLNAIKTALLHFCRQHRCY